MKLTVVEVLNIVYEKGYAKIFLDTTDNPLKIKIVRPFSNCKPLLMLATKDGKVTVFNPSNVDGYESFFIAKLDNFLNGKAIYKEDKNDGN